MDLGRGKCLNSTNNFIKDEELRRLVDIYGANSWHRLCKFMANKTEIRCFKRWLFLKDMDQTSPKSKKSDIENEQMVSSTQWTANEDEILRSKVEQFGTQNWVIIARFLPGRLGR